MAEAKEATEEISDSSTDMPNEVSDKKTTGDDAKSDTQRPDPLSDRQKAEDLITDQLRQKPEEVTEEVVEENKEVKEDAKVEESNEAEKLQEKINKRIGKEVAKRKSVEEEKDELANANADLKARIEALEAKKEPVKEEAKKDPTIDDVVKAYKNAKPESEAAEGELTKESVTAYVMENLKTLTAEVANKIADERIGNMEKQNQTNQAQQVQWNALVTDYTLLDKDGKPDMKHPLNLQNQNSLLYQTALKNFKNKALAQERGYDRPDKVLGFRLAVSDAHRAIVDAIEKGEVKLTQKKENLKINQTAKQRKKSELASSDAESVIEETSTEPKQSQSADDKVAEAVRERKEFLDKRMTPTI